CINPPPAKNKKHKKQSHVTQTSKHLKENHPMKLDTFVKTLCAAALATGVSTAPAQQQFDTYLGQLETHAFPLPLAADSSGRLYYGTTVGTNSAVYVVDDPVGTIGLGINTRTLHTEPSFPASRGFQGLAVDADGNVYAAGDTGASATDI